MHTPLCKISFHLIGHTLWFDTEIKFSYFEPPLLFCNGDSKNENSNSLQKYRVRPIKWKGILHRLTIWNQKLSKHTPVESALKMGLIFSDFENYSKSSPGKISLLIVLVFYTYEIGKTAQKPRVMSFLPWIGCQTVVYNWRLNLTLRYFRLTKAEDWFMWWIDKSLTTIYAMS